MTPQAESAAIQAVDRANQLQMIGGYAISLLGLALFFYLVLGRHRDRVPKPLIIVALLMCFGGVILANWLLAI